MERGAWGWAAVLCVCSSVAWAGPRSGYAGRGIVYDWYASNYGGIPESYVFSPGYTARFGYPLTTGALVRPGVYWPAPMPMSVVPNSPMSPPPDALPAQISPWINLPGPKIDPAEKPVVLSSAAARLKALKLQANGDQYLRKQMWYHANVNYKQAISAADDLAEAHLRYGIALSVLKRFDEALKQFKRAVFINPALARSAVTLESLLGPDSRLIRSSLLIAAADWLEADLGNADRLFVMGVLLHFNQDERAQELFSAALPISGNAAYIAAFLPEGKAAAPQIVPPPAPKGMKLQKPPAAAVEAPPSPGLDN